MAEVQAKRKQLAELDFASEAPVEEPVRVVAQFIAFRGDAQDSAAHRNKRRNPFGVLGHDLGPHRIPGPSAASIANRKRHKRGFKFDPYPSAGKNADPNPNLARGYIEPTVAQAWGVQLMAVRCEEKAAEATQMERFPLRRPLVGGICECGAQRQTLKQKYCGYGTRAHERRVEGLVKRLPEHTEKSAVGLPQFRSGTADDLIPVFLFFQRSLKV